METWGLEIDMNAERPFRFFDNREKYLLFVTTCSEKWAIGQRIGAELPALAPEPPALRVFDAGTGDGTVMASVLRQLHGYYPTVPFLVVGKEISLEDVRLTLEKLPDRFSEHPQTVVVLTNLNYREAPWLRPADVDARSRVNWREVALDGSHRARVRPSDRRSAPGSGGLVEGAYQPQFRQSRLRRTLGHRALPFRPSVHAGLR